VHKHKIEVKKMPGGDRTGPWGAGPLTGRAAGYCAGHPVPGYANPTGRYARGFGRGWGRGRGRGFGRGWGRGWYAYPPATTQPTYPPSQPPTQEQEVTSLENYYNDLAADKADLERELNDVKAKIDELKAKANK